jgi:hypothetical protein
MSLKFLFSSTSMSSGFSISFALFPRDKGLEHFGQSSKYLQYLVNYLSFDDGKIFANVD